jgi:hypothetical protein
MDQERERDIFQRMEIVAKRERAAELIARYRHGIGVNQDKIDWCNEMLGRIAQRLGEPEEEEPRWT